MNSPVLNKFDPVNAAALCRASAGAYLDCADDAAVVSRLTDTHVRITDDGTDLIVAFRGTADVRNWLTDLDCGWGLENGFRVHRGFARALDSVEAEVCAEIIAREGEGRRIWLTGHSLGGALAMLFAWRLWYGLSKSPRGTGMVGTARRAVRERDLSDRSPRRQHNTRDARFPGGGDPTWDVFQGLAGVYTYGQPRVGDSTFRDCYNFSGLMGRTFRVVHADDIVPRVPWLLGAYRHAGHEAFAGKAESRKQKAEIREGPGVDYWMLDSGFFAKLPWDLRNAGRELFHGRLALLADHHVSTYLGLFQAGSIQPVQRLCL